jgi:hypothetical protein
VRIELVRMELERIKLERIELEEENQVIRWREGHQKGLGWLDVVGGMYNKA